MSGQKETTIGNKKNPKTNYTKTNLSSTSSTTSSNSKTTGTAIPSTPQEERTKAQKELTNDNADDYVKEVDETNEDYDKNLMKYRQEIYNTMKKLNDKVDQNAESLEEVKKKMKEDEAVKEETLNAIIQSQIQNIQNKTKPIIEEINTPDDESLEEEEEEILEEGIL